MSDHNDQYRPGYHFTPGRYWMNDPNGLVHHGGLYHLFFQYNPEGDVWGNMSWGYATSPDLVRWTEHPVAMPYSGDEEIYSGSIVVDHRNTSGFGEGVLVAVYTSVYSDGKQAQSLAYSTDGLAWTKYAGNPVLDRGSKAFRDPKVSWNPAGGYWVMVAVEAEAREVVFYRSADLRNWDYLSTFGPTDGVECLWECPDLFALPIDGDPDRLGWVLVVSLNPDHDGNGSATRYFVGDFDGATFTSSGEFNRFDWGRDLYATVSFDNEPHGRRIMVGWMSNWDYAGTVPTSPWRGSMSLPREVSLVTIGEEVTLFQRPPRELGTLDGEGVSLKPFDLEGTVDLEAGQRYRLDVIFDSIDAEEVGLDLLVGDGQATRLKYRPRTELLTLDRTRSGNTTFHPTFASIESATVPLRGGKLRLQVFVDRGSVEVFAQDGEVCLTDQVFPGECSTGLIIASFGGSTLVARLEWVPLVAWITRVTE